MTREFILNIAFLVGINLLIKPFYLFGIDRTVQNTVPPGDYGLYFLLFNFTFLFQIVNDFGIQHFNNRNIARHRQLLDKYLSDMLVVKGLLALVYAFLVFSGALLLGYPASGYPLLLTLVICQILTSLILFLRSNVSGLSFYRTDSLLSVLDRVLVIAFAGVWLLVPGWRSSFQVQHFALAQAVALGLTAAVAFAVVRRYSGALRWRWRPRFLGMILRQSYPYAMVIFLMTVYTRIDAVMIERLRPDGLLEADLYASAYRLLDACNMIGFLFASLLFPMFARLIGEGQPVGPLVRLSLQLLWAGAGALATATVFFRTEIMVTLYDHGGAYSGLILAWLMGGFLAISGSYIYGTLLGAKGSLRIMNLIALSGVLVNVLLNLLLIPQKGAAGAAAATCMTQFLVFFAQVLASRRQGLLGAAPGLAIRLFAYVVAVAAINQAFHSPQLPFSWEWRFLAALAVSLLPALALRLIEPRQMLAWLRAPELKQAGGR